MNGGIEIAVLARLALREWQLSNSDSNLPYGMQHIEQHGYDLSWSDGAHARFWNRRPLGKALRTLNARRPGLRGIPNLLTSIPTISRSGAVLSIFEDAGLALGRTSGSPFGKIVKRPHLSIACWLSENCLNYSNRQRTSVRKSLLGLSGLLVYSSNQVDVLRDAFDLSDLHIASVPFGVDTKFYSYSDPELRRKKVLAVGSDVERDYKTFLRAVDKTSWDVTLVCQPHNLNDLVIPENVKVLFNIGHDQYLELLKEARCVVTPTTAPNYPSGQSTLLEAMSVGVACVMTESAAIKDYVSDGHDVLLVPPGDAKAMHDAIELLLDDENNAQSIGESGSKTVASRFSFEESWAAIAKEFDLQLIHQTSIS